jgi:hypothetical protein
MSKRVLEKAVGLFVSADTMCEEFPSVENKTHTFADLRCNRKLQFFISTFYNASHSRTNFFSLSQVQLMNRIATRNRLNIATFFTSLYTFFHSILLLSAFLIRNCALLKVKGRDI